MDEHLGIPFHALVELVVRGRRLVEVDVVAHDEAGLGFARDDQVAEVAVVFLHVALEKAVSTKRRTSKGNHRGCKEGDGSTYLASAEFEALCTTKLALCIDICVSKNNR